jgi:hypothetical protein
MTQRTSPRLGIVTDVQDFLGSMHLLAHPYAEEGFVGFPYSHVLYCSERELDTSSVTAALWRMIEEVHSVMVARVGIVVSGGPGESDELPCEATEEFKVPVATVRASEGRVAEVTGIASVSENNKDIYRLIQYILACMKVLDIPSALWACSERHAEAYRGFLPGIERLGYVPFYGGVGREGVLIRFPIAPALGARVGKSPHTLEDGLQAIRSRLPCTAQRALSASDRENLLGMIADAKEAAQRTRDVFQRIVAERASDASASAL